MEDSEKPCVDNNQETECKVIKEEVPCAAAGSGDVNSSNQGGEDLNNCREEDKEDTSVKTEMIDQAKPLNEASEPIEGPDVGIIIAKSEDKELTNTETEIEAQTATTSVVEKQTDVKNEVVECDEATNCGIEESDSSKNDVVDGNNGEDVKKPNEDVMEKKPKEMDKEVENADYSNAPAENRQLPTEFAANKDPQGQDVEIDDVWKDVDEEMKDVFHIDQDKMVIDKELSAKALLANQHDCTPNSLVRCSSAKAADCSGEALMMGEDDDGTPEDQAAFIKELEHFHRERVMDFKPLKFYGQPLNLLKLWRAIIRLGGYDRVTESKLWRQVGESFHPPKDCTIVSWTTWFSIFYKKFLLEYERHKTQSGELQLPIPIHLEVSGGDVERNGCQGSGVGRAKRDSAGRTMHGLHAQHLGAAGEAGDPTITDKNLNNMVKNEMSLKSAGTSKQKRPTEQEYSSKAARTDVYKHLSLDFKLSAHNLADCNLRLVPSVVDVGSPADWVKINICQTKDSFEVYALVPGLLHEEVQVQIDPAGRLVISGHPKQVHNQWGVRPFKKIIRLPARVDSSQTSAVISLQGRLLVRIPFEQPNV